MAKNKKNRDNNTASKLAIISALIGMLSSLISLITKLIEILNEQLYGEWEHSHSPNYDNKIVSHCQYSL